MMWTGLNKPFCLTPFSYQHVVADDHNNTSTAIIEGDKQNIHINRAKDDPNHSHDKKQKECEKWDTLNKVR